MNQASPSRSLDPPAVSRRLTRTNLHISGKLTQLRTWSVAGLVSALVLYIAFIVNGSDFFVTFCLCLAWLIAMVGTGLAGGFKTLTGWFTFFPFFHYLLFSLPLKAAFGEHIEERLRAPEITAFTMLIYFTMIVVASLLARRLWKRRIPLCEPPDSQGFFNTLAWTCFIVGTLGAIVGAFGSMGSSETDTGQSVGGVMGIARFLVYFENFSVGVYAFSIWRAGSSTLVRSPTFWIFALTGMFIGILSSTKSATTEPLAYLVMAGICAKGMKFKGLLVTMPLFVAALMFVYPVMHYARGLDGARTGTFYERLSIVGSVLIDYLTDPKRREEISGTVDDYQDNAENLYLSQSVGVFDRFMMIGNADLLISSVNDDRQFHGFHLFKMGLQLMMPRFVLPDKPDVGSTEELSDVAGTRNIYGPTYATWGIPAALYFSLGLPGVLFFGFIIQFVFMTLMLLLFGDSGIRSVWFPLLIVRLNGITSCGSIDGLPFTMFWFLFFAVSFYLVAKSVSRLRYE